MCKIYIIQSASYNKFYTGHTQDLENRLLEHNLGETKSIKNCTPWKLVWQTEVETRGQAMKIENKIKKRSGKISPGPIQIVRRVSRGA